MYEFLIIIHQWMHNMMENIVKLLLNKSCNKFTYEIMAEFSPDSATNASVLEYLLIQSNNIPFFAVSSLQSPEVAVLLLLCGWQMAIPIIVFMELSLWQWTCPMQGSSSVFNIKIVIGTHLVLLAVIWKIRMCYITQYLLYNKIL